MPCGQLSRSVPSLCKVAAGAEPKKRGAHAPQNKVLQGGFLGVHAYVAGPERHRNVCLAVQVDVLDSDANQRA